MADDVSSAKATRAQLQWAASRSLGAVSEIAVMSPIRIGCPPGERRTYEERLRMAIADLAQRAEKGMPNELDRIPTIHFGRMLIVRPEQYLAHSNVEGVTYWDEAEGPAPNKQKVPTPIDDYDTILARPEDASADAHMRSMSLRFKPEDAPVLRSWLITLVEFDGDLRTYMREIAASLNTSFDLIFRNCENYPGTQNFELFWLWLKRYQIGVDLFYARYPNLTATRIKELEVFKARFDAFVAKVRTPTGRRVASMDELFDEFLRETHQHAADFPTPGGVYKTWACDD